MKKTLINFLKPMNNISLQYFDGWRLKLPGWMYDVKLSPTQSLVVKILWGQDNDEPPVMTWKQIQCLVGTNCKSFGELFKYKKIVKKVGPKKYQLCRN